VTSPNTPPSINTKASGKTARSRPAASSGECAAATPHGEKKATGEQSMQTAGNPYGGNKAAGEQCRAGHAASPYDEKKAVGEKSMQAAGHLYGEKRAVGEKKRGPRAARGGSGGSSPREDTADCGEGDRRSPNTNHCLVGEEGFEPSRPFGHTDLNRARLPFRHPPRARKEG
jgi:hypothetical protein